MPACLVEKLPSGFYRISRDFSNKSAALAAMEKILSVNEVAFEPVPQEIPLPQAVEAILASAESADSL